MRPLFFITLALYAFSVMDMHMWAHVPQSIVHWVEHHSDLGHHDHAGGHHHDEHGDHDPFNCEEHGPFAAFTCASVALDPQAITWNVPIAVRVTAVPTDEGALSAYSGSKWNPPRHG